MKIFLHISFIIGLTGFFFLSSPKYTFCQESEISFLGNIMEQGAETSADDSTLTESEATFTHDGTNLQDEKTTEDNNPPEVDYISTDEEWSEEEYALEAYYIIDNNNKKISKLLLSNNVRQNDVRIIKDRLEWHTARIEQKIDELYELKTNNGNELLRRMRAFDQENKDKSSIYVVDEIQNTEMKTQYAKERNMQKELATLKHQFKIEVESIEKKSANYSSDEKQIISLLISNEDLEQSTYELMSHSVLTAI